jgi:radical SAM protein with 4Fe4S-binding SPASM domain
MTPANLRKWAEATSGKAESIRINGLGEATLSPHLDKCLEILGAFPGGREIITNFTAPLDLYARMLQVGFVILVSWDGCSAPVFEAIRRGADFGTLCQKLPRLAEHAAAIGAPDPVILFTLRPQNLHELPGTVDLVSRLGIRHMIVNTLRVRDGLDWTGPYRSNIQCVLALAAETATVRCVNLVLPDHVGGEPVRGPYVHRCSTDGCRFPFTEVVVRWDGEVTPCNMMNPYSYGHIAAHGFDACWNGPEARAFRRLANTAKRHPHCDGCCYVNFRRSRRA